MQRRSMLRGAAAISGAAATTALATGALANPGTDEAKQTVDGAILSGHGTALFCRDWGEGEPVVFLASWALPSESWCYQMMALTQAGFRCIAYDRRGHGRSSDPGSGYDFDTLADDLAAVLTVLDIQGATLIGFSMATGEIVRYLTRHGTDRVNRIVLVGTTTPYLEKADDNPHGVDPAVFEGFRREQLLKDYPKWVDDNIDPFVTPETSQGMKNWIRDMALTASMKALHDCHVAITSTDFRSELARITVPTLLLHGGADATSPLAVTGEPTAALIPGAELVVYENAPHGIPFSHTARFNHDLQAFLNT